MKLILKFTCLGQRYEAGAPCRPQARPPYKEEIYIRVQSQGYNGLVNPLDLPWRTGTYVIENSPKYIPTISCLISTPLKD